MRKSLIYFCIFSLILAGSLFLWSRIRPHIETDYTEYHFRNEKLLTEHYEKHGMEMGFTSKEAYEKAASDAANNKDALHKKEKEDNDDVYYVEATNEFVVISHDGYIRTYFLPDSGIKYFNRQ